LKENREKNFVSAVLYVHDNEATVGEFLTDLYQLCQENFESFEVICVDDSSSDNSLNEIKKACDKIEGSALSLVNMGFYHGLELSMNAGVDLAIGDFVFEFDHVTRDYDINFIMDIYNHSLNGYDIVGAAPKHHLASSSKMFYRLYNKNAATPNKLKTESFRILSRRAINRVHSISKTVPYRKAIYASCGLKIDSLEYENKIYKNRLANKAESGFRKAIALDSLMLFTNVAFKLSTVMTFIMMGVTVGMAVYALVLFILGNTIEGWTTTVLFLSFGFFGIFVILAIIIKYLSLLLDLIFKKEKYFIMSIEKITK
jgi:polyisoprenyl-phosphate glycosyltransferase